MKKTTVLILCLALVSLACVWTASPMVTETADAIAPGDALVVVTSTAVPRMCARVTGAGSLNLRIGPGVDEYVIGWLMEGEEVTLISAIDTEWWFVQSGALTGYARSVYLVIQKCEKH